MLTVWMWDLVWLLHRETGMSSQISGVNTRRGPPALSVDPKLLHFPGYEVRGEQSCLPLREPQFSERREMPN